MRLLKNGSTYYFNKNGEGFRIYGIWVLRDVDFKNPVRVRVRVMVGVRIWVMIRVRVGVRDKG